MASSAKYQDSKFNLAAQGKRQPGSTFKIMALVAAVREGVNPNSTHYASGPAAAAADLRRQRRHQVLRRQVPRRLAEPRRGDAALRQHRLRAPGDGPRPEEGRQGGRGPGDHVAARRLSVRDARRPGELLLAAGDGQRLRDDRLRRLAQPAQGDHEGELPRRQRRGPVGAAAHARVRLRGDVRGDEDPASRTSSRAPAGARRSAARRAARPGRPTRTPTPGSPASRRSSRPPCGSASRRGGSRWATCSPAAPSTAARSPRRSGAAT